MAGNDKAPIIIKKKVSGHGGHHGGAWKVAYADFVTAMMALFIVLWLMNTKPPVKEAVAGYFKDPTGKGKLSGSSVGGHGTSVEVSKDDMSKLKEKLEGALKQSPSFAKMKDQVEMTVTGEGLRIELLETEKGMFFESGRPQPTENGRELLSRLAGELGKMPNHLMIEGHTDARPYSGGGRYSNWELSADRANEARQLMQTAGLRSDQVMQVRGFADQSLRKPNEPNADSNRRVSVIVRYQDPPPGAEEKTAEGTKGGAAPGAPAATGHGAPATAASTAAHGAPAAANQPAAAAGHGTPAATSHGTAPAAAHGAPATAAQPSGKPSPLAPAHPAPAPAAKPAAAAHGAPAKSGH